MNVMRDPEIEFALLEELLCRAGYTKEELDTLCGDAQKLADATHPYTEDPETDATPDEDAEFIKRVATETADKADKKHRTTSVIGVTADSMQMLVVLAEAVVLLKGVEHRIGSPAWRKQADVIVARAASFTTRTASN